MNAISSDVALFRFLNESIANPAFDTIMPFVTDFNNWRIVVILIWSALVIFGKTRGRWAALMLIPIIVASDQLSSSVIKPLIERMRPCEVLGGVHLWYGHEGWITTPAEVTRSYKSSFSFPSSHAANMTASMLFLGLVYRRWLAPLLAVALLVSFSRIYTGVHWPSDAAAGIVLGALIAWPAYLLFKRFCRESVEGMDITQSEPDTPPSE
jgi:undecaprenyl-diphosphatase